MIPAIGSSQYESAFRRGNAMSGAPIISGMTKFARPANAGITNRKIISEAWTEMRPLYSCGSRYCAPGFASSARKIIAIRPPGEEEEDRRHEVLDSDHLVVGVDPEVVAPAAGAVAGVVLGLGRVAEAVLDPVVEGADAGQEADRSGDQRPRP